MRTAWFGDNRDLVKWAALLHLAKQHRLSVILQICFLNQHDFPPITVGGQTMQVPAEVIRHFRSVRSVERLSNEVAIKVFDLPFTDRGAYLKEALGFVAQFSGQRRAVFLDPDTGLAPQKADVTHVTDSEAGQFWGALSQGDVLVLYQHKTNRNGRPWVDEKRKQFASAIGVSPSRVSIAKGDSIAHDVAFYYASKV